MISTWLLTIFAVFIIFVLGLLSMAAVKDFIGRFSLLMLCGLSWLTGCFVVGVSSYVVFFLGLADIELNSAFIILLPTIVLFFFNERIFNNLSKLVTSVIEKRKTFNFKNTNYLELFVYLLIAIFVIQMMVLNIVKPTWAWDAWMIWSFKAKLLFNNLLTIELLKNSSYYSIHPDYPLFVPLVQSFIAKMIGVYDEQYTQVFFTLSFISFIIVLYDFIKRFVQGLLAVMLLIPFISLPILVLNFTGAYVDGIMLVYHLLAVYFLYMYFASEDINFTCLLPVIASLACMLMTKNEGTLYCLSLFIISIVMIVLYYKDNLKIHFKNIFITFFIAGLFHLPWMITTKSIGITNRFVSADILSSSDIGEMLSEIPVILHFMFFNNLLKFEFWGVLFYVFFLMLVIGIVKKYYHETVFFIGALSINVVGVFATYVICPHELISHLTSSIDRVTLSLLPLVICYMVAILPDKQIPTEEEKNPLILN